MERPADMDAAIELIASARRHIEDRTPGTLELEIVRDLVASLRHLAFAIDRHRPEVRGRARRDVLEEIASSRQSQAKLDALKDIERARADRCEPK